jgi:hypothetical protein
MIKKYSSTYSHNGGEDDLTAVCGTPRLRGAYPPDARDLQYRKVTMLCRRRVGDSRSRIGACCAVCTKPLPMKEIMKVPMAMPKKSFIW